MSAARKAPARRYPRLPAVVQGAGGTITVAIVSKIEGGDAEHDMLGVFRATERRIEVLASLRGDQRWLVLFHELAHAALWDSGASNHLPDAVEEAVCDAIATARIREKFG